MQSVDFEVAAGVGAVADWISSDDLPGFLRGVDATLRVLGATRLRVSLVAVGAPGVPAETMARAVRHGLGAQEPMVATADGNGVVFLYLGPRGNAENDDRPLQQHLRAAIGRGLGAHGYGTPPLAVVCVHGWTDSLTEASELLRAG